MSGLIEKLHFEDVIAEIKIQTKSDNLEDIYSGLYSRPVYKDVKSVYIHAPLLVYK